MSWVLLLLFSCGEASLGEPLAAPRASAELRVESRRVAAGAPVGIVERLEWQTGWSAPETSVEIDGLEVALVSDENGEVEGRVWREKRYALTGENGSYFLPAGVLLFEGPAGEYREVTTPAIDVDIGIQGPTSELEELEELPVDEVLTWRLWAVLAILILTLLGVAAWIWKRKRPGTVEEVVLVAPDLEALEAWSRVRENPDLDDHERAVELSRLFRRYIERVMTCLPATRWTQREILFGLESVDKLGEETLLRCRSLLSATDTLKFARRGGGDAFFDALDHDLKQVIEHTRPPVESVLAEEAAGA